MSSRGENQLWIQGVLLKESITWRSPFFSLYLHNIYNIFHISSGPIPGSQYFRIWFTTWRLFSKTKQPKRQLYVIPMIAWEYSCCQKGAGSSNSCWWGSQNYIFFNRPRDQKTLHDHWPSNDASYNSRHMKSGLGCTDQMRSSALDIFFQWGTEKFAVLVVG